MGLKEVYYSLEEKYYNLLDKINKVIPLYKIVDPIDKIFPSFILCIIVVLILILVAGVMLAPGFMVKEEFDLAFKVTDEEGRGLGGSSITVEYEGTKKTLEADLFGKTDVVKVTEGTMVSFKAIKDGYESFEDSIEVKKNYTKEISLKELIIAFQETERNIEFYDSVNTSELVRERLYLYFSCENYEATPPDSIDVSDGRTIVSEPSECEGLSVTVKSSSYRQVNSFPLDYTINEIYLERLGSGEGEITIETYYNDAPIDNIWVGLYEDTELGPVYEGYTYGGEVSFAVVPQLYFIKSYDELNEFEPSSMTASIEANEERTVRISLEKNVPEIASGLIRIQVVDSANSKRLIGGAKVTLRKEEEEIATLETSIDENAIIEFNVDDEEASYNAIIDHEDYLVKRETDLRVSDAVHTVKLERFDGENGGELKVRAIDQEGVPVRNARVALYDDKKNLIQAVEETTDLNGEAEFTRVQNGHYMAFAYKGTVSGWSDASYFNMRTGELTELVVVMQIPDGTLKIKVVDLDDEPIRFANISLFDASNEELVINTPTDSNGVLNYTERADKSVYFKVEKEGFASFHSIVYQLLPNTVEEIEVVMEKAIVSGEATVEFVGVYKEDEFVSGKEEGLPGALSSGEEYIALLYLRVPEKKNYSEAGIHFRLGKDLFMENDLMYIKEVMDGEATVKKYTRFSGNDAKDDLKSLSEEYGKWTNIVWRAPEAGIHEVRVLFKVKENVEKGKELAFNYRSWARKGNKAYRDPEDVAMEEELYAAVKKKIYTTGFTTLCSDEFCFTASILDKKEDLVEGVVDSYTAKIWQEYQLEFDIVNNSKDFIHYPDSYAKIRNNNEAITFTHYSIKNADSRPIVDEPDSSYIKKVDLGEFSPNRHVVGKIDFRIVKDAGGTINITIVSGKEMKFSRDITIEVEAPKEFALSFEPDPIAAGVSNKVLFKVKELVEEKEVEKALITLKDKFSDVIVGPVSTDREGEAVIEIPAQAPESVLYAVVEKEEFKTLKQEIRIDGNFVEVKPKKLGITLNTVEKATSMDSFTIENLLYFDLKLESIEVQGDLKHLIDEDAMNDYLYTNFKGITVSAKEEREIQLRSILSMEGRNWTQREDLKGELLMVFSNGEASWAYKLPLTYGIGIGKEVDNPTCFSVSMNEWKTSTEGNTEEVSFEIENNCTVNGSPLELKDLEAMVEWKSNKVGAFTLTVEDVSAELRSTYYKSVRDNVENKRHRAILSFTPNGGVNGTGIATIKIRASNVLEGKNQLLEDAIETEIMIVNLLDCIKFSKDELRMPQGGSDSFKVETLGCGGNITFSFESDLHLSTKEIELGEEEESSDIMVSAVDVVPGQYKIVATMQGEALKTKRKVKNIYALVEGTGCVRLSKYEFDVYNDPADPYDGYDTVKIINDCYKKEFPAKVKIKDWKKAMEDALMPTLYAFLGGGLMNVVGDKIPIIGPYLNTIKGLFGITGGEEKKPETKEKEKSKLEKQKEDLEKQLEEATKAKKDSEEIKELEEKISELNKEIKKILEDEKEVVTPPESPKTPTEEPKKEESETPAPAPPETSETPNPSEGTPSNGEIGDFPAPSEDVYAEEKEGIPTTGYFLGGIPIIGEFFTKGNIITTALTFVGTTIYNYMNQDDVQLMYLERDLGVKDYGLFEERKQLIEGKLIETPEERIGFTPKVDEIDFDEDVYTEFKEGTTELREVYEVVFTNEDGWRQKDAMSPLYALFNVVTEKYEYEEEYKDKIPEKLEEITPRDEIENEFHLQFNSFKTDENIDSRPLGNCVIGSKVGETGEQAELPKVKLLWRWQEFMGGKDSKGNANIYPCSEGGYYCDATQFTIELMERINEAQKIIEDLELECPYPRAECKELSTSLINEIIKYTEEKNETELNKEDKERLTNLLGFNAYLIRDGYSADFQKDFHDYAANIAFFQTPLFYHNPDDVNSSLGAIFSNPDLFEFDYFRESSNQAINGPGMYSITIDITYDDDSFLLFEKEKLTASIKASMSKLKAPKPDSPLYYIPFDGEIGLLSDNGRVGYGTNYETTLGDPINVNDAIGGQGQIRTINIANANAIHNVKATTKDDLKTLNVDERGTVMKFERTGTETQLLYSPSDATPVILGIDDATSKNLFLFYSIEIANEPQRNVGSYMSRWTGKGDNCVDFHGKKMIAYAEEPDRHALSSEAKKESVMDDRLRPYSYGFYWSSPTRAGEVFFETVFFTPKERDSILRITAKSGGTGVKFYTPTTSGEQVTLSGVMIESRNRIDSVQKVFDLVREEKMCVMGNDSRSVEFFWNPKVGLDELEDSSAVKALKIDESCIR